jgi:two-component system sensor histidine kinase KdpD
MERLYALSRAVLLADPMQPMAKQVAREIARIYDLPAVVLYDGANQEAYRAGPEELPEIEGELSEAAVSGTLLRDERRQVVVTPVSFGGRPVGSLALRGSSFTDTALQSLCSLVSLGMEKAQSQAAASRAEAARQSEEFKSTLLDAIAHEFKTPLTSIKAGTTAILSSTITEPDQQREALAIVDAAADRLGALVTDAIHLARIEASQMRLNLQSRALRAVVQEALRHMKSALDGRDVELSLPDGLPSVLVDPELIQLVFRHLIDNALKYSPAGSPIAVAARCDGGFVALTIRNQGEGIPEWERSRIFDKFYRGAGARRVPGTGMGLAIARDVIVAHGGELRVESAPGEGAEFTLSLTAAKGEPPP